MSEQEKRQSICNAETKPKKKKKNPKYLEFLYGLHQA